MDLRSSHEAVGGQTMKLGEGGGLLHGTGRAKGERKKVRQQNSGTAEGVFALQKIVSLAEVADTAPSCDYC